MEPEPEKPGFFNPWGDLKTGHNRLPHWQQDCATYFVTWRLADSLPGHVLGEHFEERAAWEKQHPKPWDHETEQAFHRRFSARLDEWMDAGLGSCLLKETRNAVSVKETLLHFEGEKTFALAFVIMPNHVHVLFSLKRGEDLSRVVQAWKRHSAQEINRREGRSGRLWQKDYFDRLVRDARHCANCIRYIRRNPINAGLRPGSYVLFESEKARLIESLGSAGD